MSLANVKHKPKGVLCQVQYEVATSGLLGALARCESRVIVHRSCENSSECFRRLTMQWRTTCTRKSESRAHVRRKHAKDSGPCAAHFRNCQASLGSHEIQFPATTASFSSIRTPNMRPILLSGHERALTQVKYNPDGDIIFSVSKDHVVVSLRRTLIIFFANALVGCLVYVSLVH